MGKCAACGTFIVCGGVREGERVYCNAKCAEAGHVAAAMTLVPFDLVASETYAVFNGNCPECGGRGPVEFHLSHQIMSCLIFTRWCSKPAICCRSCARKHQLGGLLLSTLLGWWGFPWGLIGTPIQISRNLAARLRGADTVPSAALQEHVHAVLGARTYQAMAAAGQSSASAPPPLTPSTA